MENYTFQSRFLSGQIPFVIIYSFTPMLIFYFFKIKEKKRNKYIIALLSAVFFINPTGILLFFSFLFFFFIFHTKDFKLFLIPLILSVFVNFNIFYFIITSIFNDQFYLGTHVEVTSIKETLNDRIINQLVPKSINILLFPINELRNSLFYEFANNRPNTLRLINISLIYFFIIVTFWNFYKFLKNKIKNKNLIINYQFLIITFISLILVSGAKNIFFFILSNIFESLISPIMMIYSNPGRYLYLLYFIFIWYGGLNIKKNKNLLFITILSITIGNIYFDNKNNFEEISSNQTKTQTNKVLFKKIIVMTY